ncbi:TPA: phosphopantetheine-binding protein [Streptococcus agalactiae]|uniref:phosphopantetheine-binding protein n=1 Tax=Aerococcus mictus TaxID=2976810 RepID=UPI00227BCAA8|nr:phosphopantetheine-binding protein [Aerococcus mictus]MCY3077236.1 phosphopantetheine-binding protein [Aerococcus mictus]
MKDNVIEYSEVNFEGNNDEILITPNILRNTNVSLKTKVINEIDKEEMNNRSNIAKTYIKYLLSQIDDGLIDVDVENQHIINYWRKYTKDFKKDIYLNEKRNHNILLKLLNNKKRLFVDILTNNKNKIFLLEDKEISPEILGFSDKNIIAAYRDIISCIKKEKEYINIGIVNPGQGVFLEYLLSEIKTIKQIDLIGFTTMSIADLKRKYNGIHFEKWEVDEDIISGDNVGKFDYLFMPNVVHHFDNIKEIIEILSMTLKVTGRFYFTDFLNADSISILISIFFQFRNINVNTKYRKGFFYRSDYISKIISSLVDESSKSYIYQRGNIFEACLINSADYKFGIRKIANEQKVSEKDIKIFLNKNNIDIKKHKEKSNDFEKLIEIWKENLGTQNEIDKYSNYFKLGGDSLSATKLVMSIRKNFNCEISLTEIFSNAELQKMFILIEEKSKNARNIIEGEI